MEPAFRGVSLSTYATHTSPPSLHTDWTLRDNWKEITAEVDAHCDYIYLGAGLTYDPANPQPGIILFCSKQDLTDGTVSGQIVAFLYGETKFAPASDFPKLLSGDTELRKSPALETPTSQPASNPPSHF